MLLRGGNTSSCLSRLERRTEKTNRLKALEVIVLVTMVTVPRLLPSDQSQVCVNPFLQEIKAELSTLEDNDCLDGFGYYL